MVGQCRAARQWDVHRQREEYSGGRGENEETEERGDMRGGQTIGELKRIHSILAACMESRSFGCTHESAVVVESRSTGPAFRAMPRSSRFPTSRTPPLPASIHHRLHLPLTLVIREADSSGLRRGKTLEDDSPGDDGSRWITRRNGLRCWQKVEAEEEDSDGEDGRYGEDDVGV